MQVVRDGATAAHEEPMKRGARCGAFVRCLGFRALVPIAA